MNNENINLSTEGKASLLHTDILCILASAVLFTCQCLDISVCLCIHGLLSYTGFSLALSAQGYMNKFSL